MVIQNLEIKSSIQISKPTNIVFEAIVDPIKMSNYFISKSTGIMEEGKTVQWKFPEFSGQYPIKIVKVISNEFVSFNWDVDGIEHLVEIKLTPYKESCTIINIVEKGRPNNPAGIQWLKGNTEGWANFLACLKAYVEFGINLRKGGFDYRGDKDVCHD
jgi:uncharacterized protein YndB with AHSA1/START domain